MASTTNATGLITPPSTSSLLDDKLAQSAGSHAGKWGAMVGRVILLGGLVYMRKDIINFAAVSAQTSSTMQRYVDPNTVIGDPGPELETFVSAHKWKPETTSH